MGFFSKLFHKEEAVRDYSLPDLSMNEGSGPWSNPEVVDDEQRDMSFESNRAAEMNNYGIPEVRQERKVSNNSITSKDVELIMSKLDLIASRLDNLNRRIEYIEASRKGTNVW